MHSSFVTVECARAVLVVPVRASRPECEDCELRARLRECELRSQRQCVRVARRVSGNLARERSLKRFSGAQGGGGGGRAVALPASLAWPGLAWQSCFQLRPVLTVDVEVDG